MTIEKVTVETSYVMMLIEETTVDESYVMMTLEKMNVGKSCITMSIGKVTVDRSYVVMTIEKITVDKTYYNRNRGSNGWHVIRHNHNQKCNCLINHTLTFVSPLRNRCILGVLGRRARDTRKAMKIQGEVSRSERHCGGREAVIYLTMTYIDV